MYSQKKWLDIIDCIDNNHAQQKIAKAVIDSNSGDESTTEWLIEVVGSCFKIVIYGDKTLLVKDDENDNEYTEQMGGIIETQLSIIFNRDEYSEEDFFIVKDRTITINEDYEEKIADYISDTTGFLVDSFNYSVKFGEMDIYFR